MIWCGFINRRNFSINSRNMLQKSIFNNLEDHIDKQNKILKSWCPETYAELPTKNYSQSIKKSPRRGSQVHKAPVNYESWKGHHTHPYPQSHCSMTSKLNIGYILYSGRILLMPRFTRQIKIENMQNRLNIQS